MAKKSIEDKFAEVWETASRQLKDIVAAQEDDRRQSLEDRRFYSIAGAQWEGAIGKQFEKRPKIEVNKVHLAVIRIINEYRNNRISARFLSKDGSEDDDLTETLAGMYRADQQDSYAEEALDNAFEEAVGGGFGAFRLTHDYEDEYDEDNEYQRIKWEPITDADTCVFFDPNSKRQDKSDAKYCFVLTGMSKEAYEEEWGETPDGWDRPASSDMFDWQAPDVVYVAEYFVCEDVTEKVHSYVNISGEVEKYRDAELTDDFRAKLNDIGTRLVSTRSVKKRRVRKYFLSGSGVLEDAGYIAGREIPVVPVYGKRWFVDGRERFMGHVRLAKDPQRLYNMQVSVLAEAAASGGDETPVFLPEQVAGFENAWGERAVNRPAFLLLNPIRDAAGNEIPQGAIDYTRPPQVSQNQAALLQIAGQDIEDILGNQNAGEEIETNMSGKAIELIQSRLDMQSFIYMSNQAKAERRAAQIWLSMAGDVYPPEAGRIMKTLDDQDEPDYVDIGEAVIAQDGTVSPKYDLSRAKEVVVEIGPTSASRRAATLRNLMQIIPRLADPTDQAVVSGAAAMAMEGEGLGPVRDYFRKKMVRSGIIKPTEEEAEEMAKEQAQAAQANAQPSPEQMYLEAEAAKSQAQAMEARADAERSVAETEKARAVAIKTLADIDREGKEAAIDAFKAIMDAGTASPQNEARQQATARPSDAQG